MEDYCVICGEIVPEGRMVCGKCEREILENASNKYKEKNEHIRTKKERKRNNRKFLHNLWKKNI